MGETSGNGADHSSENEPMLARLLVGIAWEQFYDAACLEKTLSGLKHPARFGGGFTGEVKTVQLEYRYQPVRMGFAAKWNETRASYYVRLYRYDRSEKIFVLVAERELDAEIVDDGLELVENVMREFVGRARERLREQVED